MKKIEIKNFFAHKWNFLVVWGAVFFVSLSALNIAGFVPEDRTDVKNNVEAFSPVAKKEEIVKNPLPERIVIPSIKLDVEVSNPDTTDIATLDKALLASAVRYPGSGTFANDGNMFIFGHSSYLPVVHNLAYRTFNDIQKLKVGEEINVESKDTVYTYRVTKVSMVDASEGLVSLASTGKRLTLSTCNSFGDSSERFVVEADFMRKAPKQGLTI